MSTKYPTGEQLRAALLDRVTRYSHETGVAQSAIAKQSVNDPAFFTRLAKGRNFTVQTYQRVMDWFDEHWPTSSTFQLTNATTGVCQMTSASTLSS